jgi:indole-3-glycerol phosphate synthase
VLAAIVAGTRQRVAVQRARESLVDLERRALARKPRGDRFLEAIRRLGRVNVIAECKRRSPSRGVLRADYDPVAIAASYERAGAVAVSVLTEPTFFDGSLDHLSRVRARVMLPLLRKDFVVDEYQVLEAAAAGADAVLLIVGILSDEQLEHLHLRAQALGLAVLVEVHDVEELERALAVDVAIVGVNNRNLRTLAVDPRASMDLASRLPDSVIAVSESGLRDAADLVRLRDVGYRAFLIGEGFMAVPDPGAALEELLAHARRVSAEASR